jgi:rhamnosyl/mannosyltransferase
VLVTAPRSSTVVENLGGVPVIRAGRLGEVASTPISLELVRWLARIDTDLIHLHVPYPMGELAYLAAHRGRRLIVTYHSDVVRQWWARPLYAPLLNALLQRAQSVVATSPAYLASSPVMRTFADRCSIVPLGVRPGRFRTSAESVAAIRQRWADRHFPRLVLYVGRFRTYKGLPYLVRAIAGLSARLLLIGGGPGEPAVRQLVGRLGITDQVIFLGQVDDDALPAYYGASDVFVLPSIHRSEAFGIALLEAMAAGCPVISTELGTGTSWVNQSGVTGLVVPPADEAALRAALGALLAEPSLRERFGQAARERVAAEFSEEQMLERIAGLYWRAVGK